MRSASSPTRDAGALFKDPSSISWGYVRDYTASVVGHLKDRDEILLWELGNEMSFICDANPPSGNPADRISSQDMIDFVRRFAIEVKNADPDRPVTSGYGFPPRYAQHLRKRPQWQKGGDFGNDSQGDFEQYVRDMHPDPIDVISVHFYNAASGGDNQRFRNVSSDDASTLSYPKRAADPARKPLFVGEFGDTQPFTSVDPRGLFEQSVVASCEAFGIPLAAAWDFEFYQFDTTHRNDFSFDPGWNDELLAVFRASNERSGAIAPRSAPTAPHVVITTPFENDHFPLNAPATVTVQASDGDSIANVVLLVDGSQVDQTAQLPYTLTWTPASAGPHTLVAVATNAAGLATRSVPVHVAVDGSLDASAVSVLSAASGWSQVAPDRSRAPTGAVSRAARARP